jgi:hypothetical protein
MSRKVTVFRFSKVVDGRTLSPLYMAGTMEAIAALGGEIVPGTERTVEAKLLEGGFFYEHTPTNSLPTVAADPVKDESH